MPKKGVIIALGSTGNIDDVNVARIGSFFSHNGYIWCSYSSMDAAGVQRRIALAFSQDGTRFVKAGVIVDRGSSGEIDDYSVEKMTFFSHLGKIWNIHSSIDGSSANAYVSLSCSKDGTRFVKKGTIVYPTSLPDIDDQQLIVGSGFSHNGKIWVAYGGSPNSFTDVSTMLAISNDGMTFFKKGIVIPKGTSGEIDDTRTYFPVFFSYGNYVWCIYAGYDGSNSRVTLACSVDGFNFIKKGVVINKGTGSDMDGSGIPVPQYFFHNGNIWCVYTGASGIDSVQRTMLACCKDFMRFES